MHLNAKSQEPPAIRRFLCNALAITIIGYVPAWGIAAVTAYAILDDPGWRGVKQSEPTQAAPTAGPTPSPRRTADVGDRSELIGTCAIPATTSAIRSTCDAPGALIIVGTVGLDTGLWPCQAIPFTQTVRKYGDHYLCLGKY